MLFVSERIINIKELEDIIEKANFVYEVIMDERSKTAPSKDDLDSAVNELHSLLHRAHNFEFCIEKRMCCFTENCENPKVQMQDKELEPGVTVFDTLKGITDTQKFSEIICDLVKNTDCIEHIKKLLDRQITEKELQTIMSIAQSGYPLSLDGLQ